MRRALFFAVIVLMALTSCSKKLQPSGTKSSGGSGVVSATNQAATKPASSVMIVPEKPPTAMIVLAKPMIVIDETGTIITSRDKLPASMADKVDYSKITRSFTPAQRKNLIYRFKIVPPRVLFVPDHLASKTSWGRHYCVYKKKFWYWKKEDGLFHLDETYYQ
ncbi:MAG: hypothetical protein Q8R50_11415 [Sediminibacterium sp.]|nr:hypothetical protein [Sediminibacterium sp.]